MESSQEADLGSDERKHRLLRVAFGIPVAFNHYRFTPNGEGEFTFQSDAGIHLVSGYTKDGRKKA